MAKLTRLVNSAADPLVVDDLDIETAGPHGPTLLQDLWLIEHLAHLDREVTPERRIHAKGCSGLTVNHDIPAIPRRRPSPRSATRPANS